MVGVKKCSAMVSSSLSQILIYMGKLHEPQNFIEQTAENCDFLFTLISKHRKLCADAMKMGCQCQDIFV